MRAGPEAPGEPAARVSTRAKVAHGPLHLPIQLWMAYFSTLLEFEMPGPSFVPEFPRHSAALNAAANPGLTAFREALGKISKLVGKTHMLRLASQGSYRRRLQENWGIESRQLLVFS